MIQRKVGIFKFVINTIIGNFRSNIFSSSDFFAAKGVDKIAAVSNVGGFFTLAITIGFTLVSILVFFLNHGHLARTVDYAITSSFT